MSTTRSPPEYQEKYARTSSSGPGRPRSGHPWYLDRAAAESFLTREEQHRALPAPSVSDSIPVGLASRLARRRGALALPLPRRLVRVLLLGLCFPLVLVFGRRRGLLGGGCSVGSSRALRFPVRL